MAISKTLANEIIQNILGGIQYTAPTDWYFGLSKQEIVDGEIPVGAEPLDSIGYSRYRIPNTQLSGSSGSFSLPTSDGEHPLSYVTNAQRIEMSEITSGSEETVSYFFLSKNSQNSNDSGDRTVEMWGSFVSPRPLIINSNLVIEPENAVFEILNA